MNKCKYCGKETSNDEFCSSLCLIEYKQHEGFTKNDTVKPNLAILFDTPLAMEEVANVLSYGASKYSRMNWSKVDDVERYESACLRHLSAYHNGEYKDPESKHHHLAHAICSLLFVLELELKESE